MATIGAPSESEPIHLALGGPCRQRRATALLRGLLLLPELGLLVLVGAAGSLVAVPGWLATLVSGELPGSLRTVLVGLLGQMGRMAAHGLFLRGQHPVRIEVPPPIRFHRPAVALRLFLVLPSAAVAAVVSLGLALCGVVGWMLVSVTGELPESAHRALSAMVRYVLRFFGFAWMLTARYPDGLFGDPTPSAALAPARRLVAVVMVVGAAGYGAIGFEASGGPRQGADDAASIALGHAFTSLEGSLSRYESATDSCSGVREPLSCVTAADHEAVRGFAEFFARLRTLAVDPVAETARRRLEGTALQVQRVFITLAASSSVQSYERAVTGSGLPGLLRRFDRDYQRLQDDLLGT